MASVDVNEQLREVTLQGVETIGKDLGKGYYGKVFAVKHLGLVCAAKEIHSHLLIDVSPEEKKAIKDGYVFDVKRFATRTSCSSWEYIIPQFSQNFPTW